MTSEKTIIIKQMFKRKSPHVPRLLITCPVFSTTPGLHHAPLNCTRMHCIGNLCTCIRRAHLGRRQFHQTQVARRTAAAPPPPTVPNDMKLHGLVWRPPKHGPLSASFIAALYHLQRECIKNSSRFCAFTTCY